MEHDLEHTLALLTHTPAALNALLRHLPDFWTKQNEGGSTWTPFGIVEHLIHAEQVDWLPRARMILDFGESRTFEPFKREAFADQNCDQTLGQLLDEFARQRAESLAALRALHLSSEDLERKGRHPAFGVVTLSQLLATWAVHDLTHLHQVSRTLAHQYRQAVGPWSAYLGVLQCHGHSS